MIEFAAPPAGATAAPTVGHDRLDHVISGVAAGDRAAFRRLYAFMAMRVWHVVTEARLCPADAVAVARSTFVEVWHSARAATHYDARDWMATVTTGRVNDRLRIIDANGRHGVHPAEPGVGADRQNQPPTVVDYDAHVHANSPRCWEPAARPSAPAPASSPGSTTSTTHSPLSPPPHRRRRVPADQSRCHPPFRTPGEEMRRNPVHIDKAEIISVLRSRGLNARADWVDRELPELVDAYKNAALLQMLGVDPAGISPAQVASRQG